MAQKRSFVKRKMKECEKEIINKMPNEFKDSVFGNWNPRAMYHGDSYCQLYVDEQG